MHTGTLSPRRIGVSLRTTVGTVAFAAAALIAFAAATTAVFADAPANAGDAPPRGPVANAVAADASISDAVADATKTADAPSSRPAADADAPATSQASLFADKTGSFFCPPSARANAIANAKKHDWARKQVEETVAAARPWVEMSDDDLWALIIPPKLKRAIMVNRSRGCPSCGMAIYGDQGPRPYAWIANVPGHPWKVQCPNCKELFPKNDFGAFYRSAIDPKTGLFDPKLGDRSLLFNVDHPDPADPKHAWAVDDGDGWPRFGTGLDDRDWYIAYHTYFGRNGGLTQAIRVLAAAYAMTGEPIYAHKGTILLDRLADVFPDYDGRSQQLVCLGGWWDGLIGPNYWDGGMWAQRALDYDALFDGIGLMPETLEFLRAKSHRYRVPMPKESIADVRRNIEQRILIDTPRHRQRIWMNGTITEMCMAKVDLVMRGEAALREFGTKYVPAIVDPAFLNRDGSGNERSTGYDRGAFGSYCDLIEDLAKLDRRVAATTLQASPSLRAAFDFWPDIWCLERYIPNIGDTGAPGDQCGLPGSAGAYLVLFDVTGQARYAQVALRIVNGDASLLPRNIFAADPEGLIRRAIEADKAAGPWVTYSVAKIDYGLSILRSGKGDGRCAAWLFHSPRAGTSSHSHFDALNFGLYACGLEMICEHGYPLYTGDWPARWAWTSHTRSHATVTVDGRCQAHCDPGRLLAFGGDHDVRLVAAEAPCVYPNVNRYRRTLISVEVSPKQTFVVDVFRVRGGREHTYGVPMFYGTSTATGVSLAPHDNLCDGYVTNVRGGRAAAPWHVDTAIRSAWKGDVAAHLRIHGPASDATLMLADGESRWGRDDPRRLPYVFLQRRDSVADLDSAFVAVFEPYASEPFLAAPAVSSCVVRPESVEVAVALAHGGSYSFVVEDARPDDVTVRVTLTAGRNVEPFTIGGKP